MLSLFLIQSVTTETVGGVMKTAVVNASGPCSTGLTTVTVNPGSLPAGSLSQATIASTAIAQQTAAHQPTKFVVVSAPNQVPIKTEIKEEVENPQPLDLT